MDVAAGDGAPGGCLATLSIFLLLTLPVYALLRAIAGMARAYYGFGGAPVDDGPPLRVCGGCHNTVLEQDFSHCPYCGRSLGPPA